MIDAQDGPVVVSVMPQGGFKHSGHGKDLSRYGFEDCIRIKHVTSVPDRGVPAGARRVPGYPVFSRRIQG